MACAAVIFLRSYCKARDSEASAGAVHRVLAGGQRFPHRDGFVRFVVLAHGFALQIGQCGLLLEHQLAAMFLDELEDFSPSSSLPERRETSASTRPRRLSRFSG